MLKKVGMFLISGLIILKAGIGFALPIVEIEYNITESSGIWTYQLYLEKYRFRTHRALGYISNSVSFGYNQTIGRLGYFH